MKSGPTLKAWTVRPRRRNASSRPRVTVVLPTPLATPATTRRCGDLMWCRPLRLRVRDEERPEFDRLEAVWQLAVLPDSGNLDEPEVLPLAEPSLELPHAEDSAVVRVAVERGVVGDESPGPEFVHGHDEAEAPARSQHRHDG